MFSIKAFNENILGYLNILLFSTSNHYFIYDFPNLPSNAASWLLGQRVLRLFSGVKHYLVETNHPIVQIFYLIIAVGGFIGYEIKGIFKFMPNQSVGAQHAFIANLGAIFCFWIYYKACSVSPGHISSSNVAQTVKRFASYNDEAMFPPKRVCETCKVEKPARSKHCSICGFCVSKFDHHCIWIRQCVGQSNYKYFLTFLIAHGIWCTYLAWIGTLTLLEVLNRINFWNMRFQTESGGVIAASGLIACQYVLVMETLFTFLIVMCWVMGITLIIFFLYHLSLVANGTTTNEKIKISSMEDYYNKELDYLLDQEKRLSKNSDKLPDPMDFREEQVPLNDWLKYKELCRRRLAVLSLWAKHRGLIKNLKVIMNA